MNSSHAHVEHRGGPAHGQQLLFGRWRWRGRSLSLADLMPDDGPQVIKQLRVAYTLGNNDWLHLVSAAGEVSRLAMPQRSETTQPRQRPGL
jgi:hypothetical protein